ncbi:MAG: EAL domain-containing protein, partial [Cellulosilyticaceae bacterium]
DLWAMPINRILEERMEWVLQAGRRFDTITENTSKGGQNFYLATSVTALKQESEVGYYIWIGKDITDSKLMQDALYKMQYYDELTNLQNQKAFLEEIEQKISIDQAEAFTIMMFDVSKMSYINNTYGLTAGDAVLKEVGCRIQKSLRANYTLSKLNTDLFGVIVGKQEDVVEIKAFLDEVLENIKHSVKLEKGEVYTDVKVGIARYPEHGMSVAELINKAQIALSRVKKSKKQVSYMIYEPYMQDEVQHRMLLESDMHKAYENNEFIVYYQPFVDLESQKLTGVEALLRRRKGDGELVLPGKFISLLEEMELIEQVGIRVVESVCRQLRVWIDKGYDVVPVSINLSSVQFKNRHLAKNIKDVLLKYDISPKWIILEVTETVVMEDVKVAQNILKELKVSGFQIAIDDFGTGYSSLSYLKKFIFDHLKIDISFIREIAQKEEDRAIVAAIISISKALKLKTVAEGIETPQQLQLVREMGCEMGQGFLWDAPMAPEMIEEKYLENNVVSVLN